MARVAATPEEIVYDDAVRAIERQRTTAAELRSGASLLIATAAIAISLLGESAFAGADAPFAWLALSAFVIVSLSALMVIWPRRAAVESPDLARYVRNLTLPNVPGPTALRRELTVSLASQQMVAASYIARLSRAFRIGAGALIVQLVATVAARFLTT